MNSSYIFTLFLVSLFSTFLSQRLKNSYPSLLIQSINVTLPYFTLWYLWERYQSLKISDTAIYPTSADPGIYVRVGGGGGRRPKLVIEVQAIVGPTLGHSFQLLKYCSWPVYYRMICTKGGFWVVGPNLAMWLPTVHNKILIPNTRYICMQNYK